MADGEGNACVRVMLQALPTSSNCLVAGKPRSAASCLRILLYPAHHVVVHPLMSVVVHCSLDTMLVGANQTIKTSLWQSGIPHSQSLNGQWPTATGMAPAGGDVY